MALSPLPQPPSRFTLPPQQLLPSSFLKPSLLLPSPTPPSPGRIPPASQPVSGTLCCDDFFFSFFLYLAIFASPFSRKPRSLYVSLFCELQRQFAGGRGKGGKQKRGGGYPAASVPYPCPPSPQGQRESEPDLGVWVSGRAAGSLGEVPARAGDLVALRLPWWPRERSPGGRAALERCSRRHLRRRSLPA